MGRIGRHLRVTVSAGVLGLLTACAAQEDDVRALLDGWLALGETMHFAADLQCGAGVFRLRGDVLSGDLRLARSTAEALGLARIGNPFAVQVPGLSPSDISAGLQDLDAQIGSSITNTGVAARGCLSDDLQDSYVAALRRPGGTMIYDPAQGYLVVIDHGPGLAFFATGGAG